MEQAIVGKTKSGHGGYVIPEALTLKSSKDQNKKVVWDGLWVPGSVGITLGSLLDEKYEIVALIVIEEDRGTFDISLEGQKKIFIDKLSNYTCWTAVLQTVLRKLEMGHYLESKGI